MIRAIRVNYNGRIWKAVPVTKTDHVHADTILSMKNSSNETIELFASDVTIFEIFKFKSNEN
jgi:hypothetical protein